MNATIYADAGGRGLPVYGYYSPTTGEMGFFVNVMPQGNVQLVEILAIKKALLSKTMRQSDTIAILGDNSGVIDAMNNTEKSMYGRNKLRELYRDSFAEITSLHDELLAAGKKITYKWIDGRLNYADPLLRSAIRQSKLSKEFQLENPADVNTLLHDWEESSIIRRSIIGSEKPMEAASK